MSHVIFYEKPGCIGNQQQKYLLSSRGCLLEVRDLLSEVWTAARLRPFFTDIPVRDWFNLSAPRVKSGEIDIDSMDEQQAIAQMLEEPLLIRRPLLQHGTLKQAGFLPGPVLEALGVALDPDQDLQRCPMTDSTACETSA